MTTPCYPPAEQPLFSLGQVLATPGALAKLQQLGLSPLTLIQRHVHGDWGCVPIDDAEQNRWALNNGARLLSSYQLAANTRVWVITEADRSATTLLLPEEY